MHTGVPSFSRFNEKRSARSLANWQRFEELGVHKKFPMKSAVARPRNKRLVSNRWLPLEEDAAKRFEGKMANLD